MKFLIDHDYHIHTGLSSCSGDAEQNPTSILNYAKENGLKEVVITDHFWDSAVYKTDYEFYRPQTFEHIKKSLPLPQSDEVKMYFGGETEMDKNYVVGVSQKAIDQLDFLIIPTTHMHMDGFTVREGLTLKDRAEEYVTRLDKLLSYDLPFHKIGIAHLTCPLMARGENELHLSILDSIPDKTYLELYGKIAKLGAGFELNFLPYKYKKEELPRLMRPYELAKKAGCKFYLGSDNHHHTSKNNFSSILSLIDLTEDDKFRIKK